MTTYPITIVNPGAETGDTTGWVDSGGSGGFQASTFSPHTGTYHFRTTGSLNDLSSNFKQTITLDGSFFASIDAGLYSLYASAWHQRVGSTSATWTVSVIDEDGVTVTASSSSGTLNATTWTQSTLSGIVVAPGTRYIVIECFNGEGLSKDNEWDDFELWFDDTPSAGVRETQIGVLAWGTFPSAGLVESQGGNYAFAAAETSNTHYEMYEHQAGVYAWVRAYGDRRKLRAWRFPQDDHEFYVLQLGNNLGTLVYDMTTQQWAKWKSPLVNYWKGADGLDWEGFNVCCDVTTGIIWQIDDEGRLDEDTTPITSIITGGMTERFRTNVPCYMAELAVSEGEPPTGIDASTLTISLRTGDTLSWYDHGSVTGEDIGDNITVRWYGLGLMSPPGRIFEITDTGYARRIDGLNIEIGDYGSAQ